MILAIIMVPDLASILIVAPYKINTFSEVCKSLALEKKKRRMKYGITEKMINAFTFIIKY